ncbi:MAG: DUF4230 domain-containing protein [Chthoniobacterales bacterium]
MELPANRRADESASRRLGCPLAATLLILILALLAGFIFYRLETWPRRTASQSVSELERLGREARDAFVKLAQLQPRVTVNNRVYLEQTSTIAELSVLARRVEVEHEMLHTWAGSTKRMKLHGTFLVKAGFNLRQKFSVNISPNEITIELPHAQILSVEEQNVQVLVFENGFWNRISPADIQNELTALPRLAREKSAGLPAQAEQTFTRELLEKFHPPQPVRAIFPAPSPRN